MAKVTDEIIQLEARDGSIRIFDTTPGAHDADLTRPRDAQDPEQIGGPRGADGLWDGFSGAGYLDMGRNRGDAFSFTFVAHEAETFSFSFRYASLLDRPMDVLVDGVSAGRIAFGSTGAFDAWAFAKVDAALSAGSHTIRLVNVGAGGPNLDRVAISHQTETGDPNADVAVHSLQPGYFDDRLVFNWLENPVAKTEAPREYTDTAVFRISNTGTSALHILDAKIDKYFSIETPNVVGSTIAPGGHRDVTVSFNGDTDAPNSFPGVQHQKVVDGKLVLTTNDADSPQATIDLSAIWQKKAENGNEPSVNDVWHAFGFGTEVDVAALKNYGVYEKANGLEVLSPLWRLADGVSEAHVTQLAAYHSPGGAPIRIHAPGDKSQSVPLFNHAPEWNQSVLPHLADGSFPTASLTRATVPDAWAGDDVFSLMASNYSTDPTLNKIGSVDLPGDVQQGHLNRIFQALDADGHVLPNVWLSIQDSAGVNLDYNDSMLLIEGLAPVDPLV